VYEVLNRIQKLIPPYVRIVVIAPATIESYVIIYLQLI